MIQYPVKRMESSCHRDDHRSTDRIGRQAVTIFCLMFAISACSEAQKEDDTDGALTIGLLLPYTGGDAAIATNYERAAIIAKDMINDAGGIVNRSVHLISRDTHSDSVRAEQALEELLSYDPVAIIGPESAEIARTLLPLLQQKEVFFFSPVISGSESLPTSADTPWFRLAPSSARLGHAFANHLRVDQNLDSISTVYSNDDYNSDFIRSLETRFEQLGGNVETSVSLSGEQHSYGPEVNDLLAAGTHNVVLAASVDSASRFVNELSVSSGGESLHWFLSPGLQTPVFLQNTLQSALEGAVGIGLKVENLDLYFIDEYQTRWEDKPLDGAFFYFDAVTVLSLAMATASFNNGGALTYDAVKHAVFDIASPSGVQVRWSDQFQAFTHIAKGRPLYYSGLTGALLLTDDGQQKKALMTTWSVIDGQIVVTDAL